MLLVKYYVSHGVSRNKRNTSNSCKKCRNQVVEHCGGCTLIEINILTVLSIKETCN